MAKAKNKIKNKSVVQSHLKMVVMSNSSGSLKKIGTSYDGFDCTYDSFV
jgi:hypothetical protein